MKKLSIFFVIFLIFLTSCSAPTYESSNFFVMDTLAEVRVYGVDKNASNALIVCKQVAESLEQKISATKEGSDTYAFNHSEADAFSDEFIELTRLSLDFSELTDGYFDATSGRLIDLWKGCEEEGRFPTDAEKATALHALGYQKIQVDENTVKKASHELMLDFGAIGKGYAADKMEESLKENGIECGMISFVSSVTVFGGRDFKIGIRRPDTSGELCGYVTLRDESLSVSGDYERFYEIDGERYPHILNTKTGEPASSELHSVVVISDSGVAADALSTAIFVMGIERAAELYQRDKLDFEFLCITGDKMVVSEGFAEHFEAKPDSYHLISLSEYISER